MDYRNLKQQREELNLSQQAVANELDCHVQTISKIERGVAPSTSKVIKLYEQYLLSKKK